MKTRAVVIRFSHLCLAALSFALSSAAFAADEVPFDNITEITINDNANASPYPSNIIVNGLNPALVTRVQVSLSGLSHNFPDDVDVILVGPQGQRAVLMSDAGGDPNVSNVFLTFDGAATATLPDSGQITTGTFRPVNYETTDTFPAPGPGALAGAAADLSVFHQTNPNGTWNLYVVDDELGIAGSIAGGWILTLTVPEIFTVNSAADADDGFCDAGDCTLREAITAAQDGDLINFSSLFDTPQTIYLTDALPPIATSITIVGKGAHLLTVRRDYNAPTDFRIFDIPAGVTNGVAISGMTIAGGRVTDHVGGGIRSHSSLTLTGVHVTGNQAIFGGGGVFLADSDGVFTGSTFSGNEAMLSSSGGGINYQGLGRTLRLVNSTVSGNRANSGGGILSFGFGNTNSRLEVISSTIVNNIGGLAGGGIRTLTVEGGTSAATTTLRNSIIANNSANTSHNLATETQGGGTATCQTLGFNLSDNFNGVFTPAGSDNISATPRLGPLSLGGGTTPTHALLGGSPALDTGNASGQATDQRGEPRIFNITSIAPPAGGDNADIGAVEMQAFIVTTTANSGTGSLRNTISNANNDALLADILFDPAVFDTPQTITLESALPDMSTSVAIHGPSASLLTVRRDPAAANFRIFNIASGITGGVAISGMKITGGSASGDFGGGINSQSSLALTNVHVTGNSASNGGGGVALAFADGVFTGCTFSGNTGGASGGGINYQGDGGRTLRLAGSTVSGNQANTSGGGIQNTSSIDNSNSRLEVVGSTIANNIAAISGGIRTFTQGGAGSTATTTLRNSIIAGNTPTNLAQGTSGGGMRSVITHGFNLTSDGGGGFLDVPPINTDQTNAIAGLADLAENGGAVPTRALLGTSAALDAGSNSGSGTLNDGRGTGFPRTFDLPFANATGGDGTDIGAFEAQTTPTLPTISIADMSANEGNAGGTIFSFTVTLSAASGHTVSVSFATADGTATNGSDYSGASGGRSFAPGETSVQIALLLNGDMTFEPDETLTVNLSNPTNATISDGQGQGTILNDDAEPPPTPTPSPTATPTASPTATATPEPSATATPSPSATATASATATPTATPTSSPTPGATPATTLANIATRLRVETGENVLIGGIIITGTEPKKLIVRAIGPSSGVAGSLDDPQLEMFDGEGTSFALNDNWEDASNAQEIIDSTIPPKHPLEAAFVGTLSPGNYTAVVSGVNGGTGIGVVEAYDLDRSVDSQFANIATRGLVQTRDDVMIGGLIILGDNAQKVIVRALGPSLPVEGKLADPTLDLINPDGDSIGFNNNWRESQEADIAATTIPPSDESESAIVATLLPGPYTAVVRGANDTVGIALVEVYALE